MKQTGTKDHRVAAVDSSPLLSALRLVNGIDYRSAEEFRFGLDHTAGRPRRTLLGRSRTVA
jgi:hypothetical protein